MIDFVEKYRPKTTSEIIGNIKQITQMETWLKNYDKTKQTILSAPKKGKKKKIEINIEDIEKDSAIEENISESQNFKKNNQQYTDHACMMLIGDHGVGKTCGIIAILNKLKYTVRTFDLSTLGSNKSIPEHISKLTKGTNIFDKLNDVNNMKTAILIDEIESANSPVEKNFILALMKSNEEFWHLPIIFISSGKHTKLNSVLKTYTNTVYFEQPNKNELMTLLIKIATEEKMLFDNVNIGNELIAYAQNDFRRLVSIIQDLKTKYGTKSITSDNMLEYQQITKKKDTSVVIFKSSAQMMARYKNIDECLKIYEKEKVIIPLVIHQNFIKAIINSRCNKSKKFTIVSDIAKSISFGDLVENYIYSDQNWDMQEVHGFMTCVEPAFKINREKINVDEQLLTNSLDFPCDLNRTSIKKINKRNIINSNVCLKNFGIKDFIFANRLIRQLLDDEKIQECVDLFAGYGAKVENVESILKIDKINEPKTILNSTIKKKLVQSLGTKKTKKEQDNSEIRVIQLDTPVTKQKPTTKKSKKLK